MKQLLLLIGALLIAGVGLTGGCGWSGVSTAQDFLHNRLQMAGVKFQITRWCTNGLPFVTDLPKILDNKTYIVLLQNNMELRPSGGFIGSFAKINLTPTGLGSVEIQDIYVPDGQIVGHVDPPRPIQQAFGQGWWRLRDSNWDPDFAKAGEQIAWFFSQGGEKVDGLIAVNLGLVNDLLTILGPVKVLDYKETITAGNFYELAQKYSEENFFPGSTQKRDFLGAVGRGILQKTLQAGPKQQLQILKLIWQQLKTKQMMLWFVDPELQTIAMERNWAGALTPKNWTGNYLYVVESNLGANKANCCIDRKVSQTIASEGEQVVITWKNSSLASHPVKPVFWGGDYTNFVRVIVPRTAQVKGVTIGDEQLKLAPEFTWQLGLQPDVYTVESHDSLQTIGFWTKVPAQETVRAVINYQNHSTPPILVKRQPGITGFMYELVQNGKIIYKGLVTRDLEIK